MSLNGVHEDVLPPLSLGAPYLPRVKPSLIGISQLLNNDASPPAYSHHPPPNRNRPSMVVTSPVTPSAPSHLQSQRTPLLKFPTPTLPSFSQFEMAASSCDDNSSAARSDDALQSSAEQLSPLPRSIESRELLYSIPGSGAKLFEHPVDRSPISVTQAVSRAGSPFSVTPSAVRTPGQIVSEPVEKGAPGVHVDGIAKKNSRRRICVNARPSASCHLCRRKVTNMRRAECRNLGRNLCRKVICEVCFHERNWDIEAATQPGSEWLCPHCTGSCPPTAHCYLYDRMNARRAKRAAFKKGVKETN